MRRGVPALVAVALLLGGCGAGSLEFRADRRLEFVAPRDFSTVSLPFTLAWSVRDFQAVGPSADTSGRAGYFAVLVDVGPMPPGQDLRYFARKDESCLHTPGCPNEQYLADRNVFLTAKTAFTIEGLADTRPRGRPSTKDRHEITVVLLNGKGARIGESAFSIQVFVNRPRSEQ